MTPDATGWDSGWSSAFLTSEAGITVSQTLVFQDVLNGGHAFTRHTVLTATLTPAAVAANTCIAQAFTVTGVVLGDQVINAPNIFQPFTTGLSIGGVAIGGADSATINFCNVTAGSITPPSGTYTFDVEQ